jgi:glycosyltransferase involved in cell wall biosynthesis
MGNENLLSKLPSPPKDKTGWPWNEETPSTIYKDLDYIPKISIITPSLNQGMFIEQTIRSVLLQNYPNLEYIIVDGGSDDMTVEIIKKYEPWIKYWVSEKDSGQSEAINKGIVMCEGDIFNWINSDDYYYNDCFKIIAKNFNFKSHDIIAGKYRFFDDENNGRDRIIDFKLGATLEETIAFILVNQPSTFFNMNIYKSFGGLNEKLHYVMDQDLWKKYLLKHGQEKVKVIDASMVNFRFHSNSKTAQFKFNNEYNSIFYSIASRAACINT